MDKISNNKKSYIFNNMFMKNHLIANCLKIIF